MADESGNNIHDLAAFGKWARARRKKMGLTQGEVAKRAGLTERRYGTIERGQANDVTAGNLERIRNVLRETGPRAMPEPPPLMPTPSRIQQHSAPPPGGVTFNVKVPPGAPPPPDPLPPQQAVRVPNLAIRFGVNGQPWFELGEMGLRVLGIPFINIQVDPVSSTSAGPGADPGAGPSPSSGT